MTLRLLRGGEPALRCFGLACVTFGILVVVDRFREWSQPIADPALLAAVRVGVVSFLAAGLLGAILSAAIWQVRTCPFAWDQPGLLRRATRELRAAGALAVLLAGAGGGLAITLADGVAIQSGDVARALIAHAPLPATAAALGFAVGLFNMDPPAAWTRPWQLPPLLAAVLPVYFMAEIASILSQGAWLWLPGSVLGMLAAIECSGAGAARRRRSRLMSSAWAPETGWGHASDARSHRAPRDGAASTEAPLGSVARRSEADVLQGEAKQMGRRWPRCGPSSTSCEVRRSRTPLPDAAAGDKGRWSARFSGPRRSDGAWVQAILHETQRGARALGVGSAVHVAVIAVVSAMLVCAYLSIDPAWLHLRSEAAGVDQIGRNGADAAESALPARLHRTSDGIAIWGTLLTYAFVLSMFTLSSPFLPALGVIHPISRARRARVVWLATQVQEGAILIALLGVSVVVAACFAMLSGEDQREGLMLRAAAAVAAWAAMPLGRWTRLRCIESISTPTAALAPAADPASPRFLAASLLSAALVIGGAVLLGAIWQQSRDASAGERIVIATLSVGAIAAVRWLWLRALIRFHRRRDLPPS